jgi:hypothetical protein
MPAWPTISCRLLDNNKRMTHVVIVAIVQKAGRINANASAIVSIRSDAGRIG